MARTVIDVAIMLNVLRSPFGPVMGHSLPHDYTAFLHTGALHGKRIGVDRRYFTPDFGGEDDLIAVVQKGLDAMTALGAILVDTDTGDPDAYFNEELTVLLFEFKVQIAQYLATRHCPQKTLADLIAFNIANCPEEMKYFGQEIFEMSEATSGDLHDPEYKAARAKCLQLSRAEGIDAAIARDHLDAIVAPSYSFASSPAAVAGYPDISIPVGLTPEGKTRRHLDVRRILARTETIGVCLRSRTGSASASKSTTVSRQRTAGTARCRNLRDAAAGDSRGEVAATASIGSVLTDCCKS